MKTLEMIMIILAVFTWACLGASFLVSSIQNFIYDRKHEKREIERDKRDLEYHNLRMKEYR